MEKKIKFDLKDTEIKSDKENNKEEILENSKKEEVSENSKKEEVSENSKKEEVSENSDSEKEEVSENSDSEKEEVNYNDYIKKYEEIIKIGKEQDESIRKWAEEGILDTTYATATYKVRKDSLDAINFVNANQRADENIIKNANKLLKIYPMLRREEKWETIKKNILQIIEDKEEYLKKIRNIKLKNGNKWESEIWNTKSLNLDSLKIVTKELEKSLNSDIKEEKEEKKERFESEKFEKIPCEMDMNIKFFNFSFKYNNIK